MLCESAVGSFSVLFIHLCAGLARREKDFSSYQGIRLSPYIQTGNSGCLCVRIECHPSDS